MTNPTNTRAATAADLADLADLVADLNNLISTADLAKLLGKSPQAIRYMRFRGQLPPATRIPGYGLRWTPEAVKTYLASINPNRAKGA